MIGARSLTGRSPGLVDRINPNVIRAIAVVIVFSLWEYVGRNVNPLFTSSPTKIAQEFVGVVASGEIQRATLQSLQVFFIGYVLAAISGIVIGMLMGRYKSVEKILETFVSAGYVAPHVAFVPLIILWFGLGVPAKVFVVTTAVIFPVLLNTQAGVRDVSRSQVDVGKAFVASERQIFFKIILPASVPFIMAGLRLAVGRAVTNTVVAEFFTAMAGLGGMILYYGGILQVSKMFTAIIVIVVLGISVTEAVKYIEKRVAPWKVTERAAR